jgi:hypothetical protein
MIGRVRSLLRQAVFNQDTFHLAADPKGNTVQISKARVRAGVPNRADVVGEH